MGKPAATKALSHIESRWVTRLFVAIKRPYGLVRRYLLSSTSLQLLRGTRPITGIILRGTLLVNVALILLLCHSYFIAGNDYVSQRLFIALATLIYLIVANILFQRSRHMVAAWMVLVLYMVIANSTLILWSINAPVGVLAVGFVLILAGVMLGAKYILPVTATSILLLILIESLDAAGIIHPDRSALAIEPGFGDVGTYGTIFAVFALITWLAGRRMEQTLKKAVQAEAALRKEKAMLAIRLEEETRKLRESQMAEMRQLYRFAELGQLSTVVMHELANHLTVLTLDMDDIQQRHHRSEAIARARESIDYLEGMVTQVRRQLKDTNEYTRFNGLSIIQDTMAVLEPKAAKKSVRVLYTPPKRRKDFPILGDPLRLAQILTILVTNAVEAYSGSKKKSRQVDVITTVHKNKLEIAIHDEGVGIPAEERDTLFIPKQSTKKHGMGIGLFIAKEIAETHFRGSIKLDARTDGTQFVITLPLASKYSQDPS